ncbi:phosphonate ABC transporter ATP-binding protein [Rhodobacteraceae bacterium WD3A24]|nr:phosphonate ABC transporter ATP-binding protein [Rhodobacteraceae bacterium WD3A24]
MVATETNNLRNPAGEKLHLEGVSKHFGAVPAVKDVTLTISNTEMVGIIGSSGAGKSTMLRLINRLIEPSAGRVQYAARDVTRLRGRALRSWRAECAMIFQQYNLSGRLDALTNVLMGSAFRNPTLFNLIPHFGAADREEAVALLHRMGLLDVALQRAQTLSGGQQQRVAIARAMMQRPALILADEPVSALDPRNAEQVMNTLAEINASDHIGVVVNLHSLEVARRYCRRVIGMRHGSIVFDATPEALDEAALVEVYGARTAATTRADGEERDAVNVK